MITQYLSDAINTLNNDILLNENNIIKLNNEINNINSEILINNEQLINNLVNRNIENINIIKKINNYNIINNKDDFIFLECINNEIYNNYSLFIENNSNLTFNHKFFNKNCNMLLNNNINCFCTKIRKIIFLNNPDYSISQFKTLKVPLSKIVKNMDIINKIEDTVLIINKLSIQTYLFIKAYVLYKYTLNIHVDVLNENFISMCVRVNSLNDNRGSSNINEKNMQLLKELETFYIDIFSNGRDVSKIKVVNMSNIISRLKQQIKTAYSNDILFNFIKHLDNFVTTTFKIKTQDQYNILKTKNEKDKFKKQLNKDLRELKNDLLNGTSNCKGVYLEWLKINRELLVPQIKVSIPYDLKTNTSIFFKYLIYINIELENNKRKTYNIFPLNKSIIPNSIELDTSSLINLFIETTTTNIQKNIIDLKNNIWNEFFDLKSSCFNYNKKYVFNGLITTDGISANITFIKKSLLNVTLTKNQNKHINEDNFKYFTDLKIDELKELYEKTNFTYVDPGRVELAYFMDKSKKTYRYTTKRRLYELETIKKRNILKDLKKRNNISIIERELKEHNSKSCNYEIFMNYLTKKIEINKKLYSFYEHPRWRAMRYDTYIKKLKSETKLVNELKKNFETKNKKCTLIYGDWSSKFQMRGCISVPGIGLKRRLSQDFKILNINEFRTSCIDYYTKTPNKTPIVKLKQSEKQIKNKKPIKTKKLNAVLMSKIHEVSLLKNEKSKEILNNPVIKNKKELTRYQNRNRNSVLNMEYITLYWLQYQKRPLPYCRE